MMATKLDKSAPTPLGLRPLRAQSARDDRVERARVRKRVPHGERERHIARERLAIKHLHERGRPLGALHVAAEAEKAQSAAQHIADRCARLRSTGTVELHRGAREVGVRLRGAQTSGRGTLHTAARARANRARWVQLCQRRTSTSAVS